MRIIPLVGLLAIGLLAYFMTDSVFASSTHPYVTQWGKSGVSQTGGLFSFPQNIATDDSGNVYVTDLGNKRVQKFDNAGKFIAVWTSSGGGGGSFGAPSGIDTYENFIFVVDNQLNIVQKFDSDGKLLAKWGGEGNSDGKFFSPNGLATGYNGTVFVADTGNNRVQKFSSDGQFLLSIGTSGIGDAKLQGPLGISLDNSGNIYVSESKEQKIIKFDSSGKYLKTIGGNIAGYPLTPHGLDVDRYGNIYVTDYTRDRIVRVDENGLTLTTWGTMGIEKGQFKMPTDVALDKFGNIFVVDSNGHRIQKFGTPLSVVVETPTASSTASESSTESQSVPKVNPVPGDLTKPVITPPNDLVLEATGGLTSVYVGQALATDPSGIASLTNNAPKELPLGTTTIIWTAIDGAGNMAIATQIVTIADTIAPIITAPPDIKKEAKSLSENKIDLGNPVASDAIGIISITNDAPEFFPIGETIVTWVAQDVASNTAAAIQKITIIDSSAPEIHPPTDLVIEASSLNKNEVFLGEPVVIDNGDILSVTNDAPQFFKIGNTTVTWVAADSSGNVASKTQTVSIIDTTSPQITPPEDVVFEATSTNANFVELGNPVIVDVQEITITNNSPPLFPLGDTVVTWTATDPSGNTASASQIVSVVDTTAPTLIVSQDIVAEATGIDGNTVELGEITVDDINGIASLTNDAPETFPFGKTVVTWTAVDTEGNQGSAVQIVSVVDTTFPVITAPDDVIAEATHPTQNFVEMDQPKLSDIIGIKSVTNDSPDVFPIGMTTVTWTAVDTSGNSASDTQIITITDSTPPKITPPNNIVVEATSPSGNSVNVGQATATDAIGIDEITNNSPGVFYLGETSVVWTATDLHGNSATAIQNITVIDTTPPSIVGPSDVTVEATTETNIVSIGAAHADDIVGVVTIENNSPNEFPVGDTLVTWTAHDAAGNFATATQKISVIDTTTPTITAPEAIQIEATSAHENVVELGEATASDSIGIQSVTNDAPDFFPVGTTTVTWIATDLGGLTSSDTQIVTVTDSTAPTINVPDMITIEATSEGQNAVDLGSVTVDDNVGVVSIINDAPDEFSLGLTTVTWTATDDAGNVATQAQQILIVDTISPVIIAPQDIVVEATGPDSTITNLGTPEVTDAVKVDTITSDSPSTFPLGITVITWTATDSAGNAANDTQIVTLVDTTPPTISEPDAISIEATSPNDNIVTLIPPEAQDSVSTVSFSNDAPDTFSFGETIVTWNASDESGNIATVPQLITLVDTTAPELIVPVDIVIDATDLVTPVNIGEAQANDLIDLLPTITNDAPFSFALGETIISWTSVDKFGNSVTANQKVTVQACGKPQSYYNVINGTPEDDILTGTNLSDLIFGFEGDDIISGMKGNDCIFGGTGDDILFGNEGNDNLAGGEGNDIIRGQSNDDVLLGGSGLDVLDGGDDNDMCNVNSDLDDDLVVKCES